MPEPKIFHRLSIDFSTKADMMAFFESLLEINPAWVEDGVGVRKVDALDVMPTGSRHLYEYIVKRRRDCGNFEDVDETEAVDE